MRTEAELDDIATMLADLTPDEEVGVQISLLSIQAERARREEERLAALRALTDIEVASKLLGECTPLDAPLALEILHDAEFVRHATLEAAYRAGYELYGYEHLGDGHPLHEEDHPSYVSGWNYDLHAIVKGA